MKFAYLACILVLTACIQVQQPVDETVDAPEVIVTNETVVNESLNAPESNIQILEPDIITNDTTDTIEANISSAITGLVIEDLSLAKQHKMIPVLESAVSNSSCYSLTWEGIDEQVTRWPLEVTKDMRFEYLGGESWKGWITSKLSLSRKLMDAETISVMIDNLSVSCPDTPNFSIDWEIALRIRNN